MKTNIYSRLVDTFVDIKVDFKLLVIKIRFIIVNQIEWLIVKKVCDNWVFVVSRLLNCNNVMLEHQEISKKDNHDNLLALVNDVLD